MFMSITMFRESKATGRWLTPLKALFKMAHLICSSVSTNTHCKLITKSFFKDVMNHKARLIK